MMNKKIISVFEICLIVLSMFAVSVIIGENNYNGVERKEGIFGKIIDYISRPIIPIVSANDYIPQGCCLEAKDGSLCQEMAQVDSSLCKTGLIGTSCATVSSCQTGCCFNPKEGLCSLNSPKDACVTNGGNWTSDASCNIAQCSLGCCVLGDGASISTSRECTQLSSALGFEKNYQPLDEFGSCIAYSGLNKKGACTYDSGDFSGTNDCKFVTKEECNKISGSFYENFLCTSEQLNTVCEKSKETSCTDDSDKIYFIDSCGNQANVYDASKVNDQSYWEKVQEPSCSGDDCGNCDYLTGSRCYEYRSGKDPKPSYGDYVCRNLNCDNGKKHGESWCISDYTNFDQGLDPVGSRFFKGSCIEGEIKLEGCADFNQEICIQGESSGFTQAQCIVNDWRSCIAANEKESYEEVKNECDKNEQCAMFLELPGTEKYLGLPGFKDSGLNVDQGRAGDLGKDANKVIAHCVPKYTPGMVFWKDQAVSKSGTLPIPKDPNKKTSTEEESSFKESLGYGGTYEETAAICALGSFTCVTKQEKDSAVADWEFTKNPECYYGEDPKTTEKWIEGLNERCMRLGPCGGKINVAGDLGSNNLDNLFKQIRINSEGDKDNRPTDMYKLSENYLASLAEKPGLVKAGSIKTLSASVILGFVVKSITGYEVLGPWAGGNAGATAATKGAQLTAQQTAVDTAGSSNFLASIGKVGSGVIAVAGAAAAGYAVGQLVGKVFGLGTSETKALSYALAAGAAAGTAYAEIAYGGVKACAAGPQACAVGIIIAVVVAIVTYVFTEQKEQYYVTTFTCSPWDAPQSGQCELCNDDVRPCTEYRCRSLGLNCNYYAGNGEPGVCASVKDTWAAVIKPWPEALTEGNKYTNVKEFSFAIEGENKKEVDAWENLQFGITTDKPASCKIDTKHTESYDDMAYEMTRELKSDLDNPNQGSHHKIILSPYAGNESSTIGLTVGEKNRYYIRCKNFAGQVNDAEFVVDVQVGNGPDLTPPLINRFDPVSGTYLAYGTNSSNMYLYVNEPSECRYSAGSDNNFKDMKNMSCVTSPNMGYLGEWACSITLPVKAGENKFYFQCKDQPNMIENGSLIGRNLNPVSKEYVLNSCSTGLKIESISPDENIIGGTELQPTELKVVTSGCVENGKAECSYSLDNSTFVPFFNTNSNEHTQEFTNTISGDYDVNIRCIDPAGNNAYGYTSFSIKVDREPPKVTRVFDVSGKLSLVTNEIAECYYSYNSCNYEFDNSTQMDSNGLVQTTAFSQGKTYYVRCQDQYGNAPQGCNIVVKQELGALIKS